MIMDVRTFSILILILPAFIYGLKCHVGGICKRKEFFGKHSFPETKECKGACVQFLCPTVDGFGRTLSMGAGCYEDFENVCKWVPADQKMRMRFNTMSPRYMHVDHNSLIFVSSTNGSDISTIFDGLVKESGTLPKDAQQIALRPCDYDNTTKPIAKKSVKCSVRSANISGNDFCFNKDAGALGKYPPSSTKSCDACVSYMYTTPDNRVNIGSGCLDDFEKATKMVNVIPPFVGTMLNYNNTQKDAFFVGPNYMVYSCSDKDDCVVGPNNYTIANKDAVDFLVNVECVPFMIKDIAANVTADPTTTTTTIATTTSKGIQTAAFGLTGMTFLALMHILF